MTKIASSVSLLMNVSEYFTLPDFNPDLLDIGYGKKLCKFHETGICLIVANTFQHSQKLEFYTSSKTDHTTFSYLDS